MGVYLSHIENFVPGQFVPLEDLQNTLSLNRNQVKVLTRIHGIEQVPMAKGLTLKQLLASSLEKLLHSEGFPPKDKIKYLIYTHTIQTVSPYPINTVNELAKEFGLTEALPMSLTMQNCASSITALDLAESLLEKDSESYAILLTGEKAFTPSVQLIPNTTVMGEASAACLISAKSGKNALLSVKQKTLGQFSNGVRLTPELMREFDLAYVPALASVITSAVEAAGLTLGDIDLILPHNINLSSWRKVLKHMDFPREKIFLNNVSKMGHCFCSDVFVNYRSAQEEGLIREGSVLVMVSVGLGATFAAAVVRH